MQEIDFMSPGLWQKILEVLRAFKSLVTSVKKYYCSSEGLAGERFATSRKQINPSQFKPVLGQVFLVDVIDNGDDFRFALG